MAISLDSLVDYLHAQSGYLANPIHLPSTCRICCGVHDPAYGDLCYRCREIAKHPLSSSTVGALTYAADRTQSARLMYGYKAARPGPSHRRTIEALLLTAIIGHTGCMYALTGAPWAGWASVPSLREHAPTEHPLHAIIAPFLGTGSEIALRAKRPLTKEQGRDFDPGHFVADPIDRPGTILLIDDSWVSGGHAQSAAVALRQAGAEQVAILAIARWMQPGYRDTTEVLAAARERGYDPRRCPWTHGDCPPPWQPA